MNVREFAEMLLKLTDQEAIVQVVDVEQDAFVDFSADIADCHMEYFSYEKSTGMAATSSWYQKNYLQLGYL